MRALTRLTIPVAAAAAGASLLMATPASAAPAVTPAANSAAIAPSKPLTLAQQASAARAKANKAKKVRDDRARLAAKVKKQYLSLVAARTAAVNKFKRASIADKTSRDKLIQEVRYITGLSDKARDTYVHVAASYQRSATAYSNFENAARKLEAQVRAANEKANYVKNTRARVVQAALSRVGAAYVAGGEGPWAFDCSGLTMWSYAQVGIEIPHYSGAQMVTPRAIPVALDQMIPGDLMYFGSGGSRHAAMYIGNGQIVEANNPSTGVRIDPAFASWNMYDYAGSTRLIY